ncbi:MAG: carbon storage regulator CsrA [Micrococcales bacterium]|nr:carbon storage regulator CsrA [Micrococcales bacterium]
MLVLSRRVGERLLIGDDIVVTVIEVRSDGVRLGIEAPREVRVHRAEVIEAVRLTNVEAVEAGDATEAALRKLVPSDAAGEPAAKDAEGDKDPEGAEPKAAPKPGPAATRTRERH